MAKKIFEITMVLAVAYFAALSYLFLQYKNTQTNVLEEDLRIKREAHIAGLIGQYHADLDYCIQQSQLPEAQCIDAMNQTNLADLIRSWGFGDSLVNPSDQPKE